MKDHIIVVEGRGRLSIEPDAAVVEATVAVLDMSYAAANTEAQRAVARLREAAIATGFAAADFKTTEFGVTRETQFPGDPRRSRFVGFRSRHTVELQLPLDTVRLNQLVEAFQAADADAEIEVRFIATEGENVRNRLLAAAVENARHRAEILTRAAGVRLGDIVHMNYGATEAGLRSAALEVQAGGAPGPEIEASAFVAEERVQMTWRLERGEPGLIPGAS